MAYEELAVLQGLHADVGPLEAARLEQARQEAREQAAEERQQAEREAGREARLGALALADQQMGGPMAGLSLARAAASAAGDEVAECEARLAKARAKLSRAEGNVRFFAERTQQVTEVVSRSAPDDRDMLAGAKRMLAEARVNARLEAARAAPPPRVASRSAGRPKGGCGCEACAAYAAGEPGRAAQREGRARLDGREITRGGGYVVDVR